MESKYALVGVLSPATSAARQVIGGYEPIKDVKDPYVVEIAKFAVKEHNNGAPTLNKLVFVDVASAEKQVVLGVNYKLDIDARAPGVDGIFETVVYDNPAKKSWSLVSFKPIPN